MNLLTSLLVNLTQPVTPRTEPRKGRRRKAKPKDMESPGIYRPVMKGKGPMYVMSIVKALKGTKTRQAVYKCLEDTLAPKGYVKRGGTIGKLTYEWIGD